MEQYLASVHFTIFKHPAEVSVRFHYVLVLLLILRINGKNRIKLVLLAPGMYEQKP